MQWTFAHSNPDGTGIAQAVIEVPDGPNKLRRAFELFHTLFPERTVQTWGLVNRSRSADLTVAPVIRRSGKAHGPRLTNGKRTAVTTRQIAT